MKHHKKIKIEGTDLSRVINKCIDNDIDLKNIKWENPVEMTVDISESNHSRLEKLTGHSYRITTVGEGGAYPAIRTIKCNILNIAGAFIVGAFIFYQSLFVAEIRIDGYLGITEADIRETLKEAGLYEGARKPEDYTDIKAALYENHKEITWVSFFEEGRLVKVNIAEAGKGKDAEKEAKSPANIVAVKSGMVEKVIPLVGNAKVDKGDYVNKGDILISGRYKYQSTDYSKGDDFRFMYSHAKGHVLAKVPRQITFYIQKTQREIKPLKKGVVGLYLKVGDKYIDTAESMSRYEVSIREERRLAELTDPVPLAVGTVRISEAEIREERIDEEKLNKVTEAAIRQYERESLNEGEKILSFTIDYSETETLVRADVFMEVLEDIGKEKKIVRNKKEKDT